MSDLLLYTSVFIGAAVPVLEVWIAVPLGVVAGLPWIPTAVVGFLGNFLSLMPVIYASGKVKIWINNWRKPTNNNPNSDRKYKILEKLGVPGLAFLGPFLIGVHAAAAFAIAMGANQRNVLFWFTISLLFCALLFGFLASLGMTHIPEEKQLLFLSNFDFIILLQYSQANQYLNITQSYSL